MQYSRGKSALVFCSTRKGAQEAAQRLSQTAMTFGYSNPFIKSKEQLERLREASLSCSDKQMQSNILCGGRRLTSSSSSFNALWIYCKTRVVELLLATWWRGNKHLTNLQLAITTAGFAWRIAISSKVFFSRVIFKLFALQILLLMESTCRHIQS